MNKLVFLAVVLAMVAVASAQYHVSGGAKDVLGNYYDYTTGQVASSATGRVYNTGFRAYPYAHHGLWW